MKNLLNEYKFLYSIFIIFLILILSNLIFYFEPGIETIREEQNRYAKKYISEIREKSIEVLNNKSKTTSIDNLKLTEIIQILKPELSSIQESYEEYEVLGKSELFIWLSDSNKFVTGEPKSDFAILNDFYLENLALIQRDKFFKTEDEFFGNFITSPSLLEQENSGSINWRFWQESQKEREKKGIFFLSNKIQNTNYQLNLIIDDSKNRWLIYANRAVEMKKNQKRYSRLINFLGFLIIWLMIPSWVYNDARKRNIQYPMIWALLPLFSFIFGLIIYIAYRPKSTLNCPECNFPNHIHSEYCINCGKEITMSKKCGGCGKMIEKHWKFCGHCGEQLNQD